MKVKLKDVSMEIYLPKKIESLVNRSFLLTQKILDTKSKLTKTTTQKNSFLEKLKAYNSQEHSTKIIDNFSSIHRLEIIFKKSQATVLNRLFDIDFFCRDSKKNEQIASFLKLKILLSYFENFEKQLKALLNDFVGGYDLKNIEKEESDIFEICLGTV